MSLSPETSCTAAPGETGLADAVLTEIATALDAFVATKEPALIDLHGIPLTKADRERLESMLGHGEVEARLSVAGETDVWETAYAAVWWVRHKGDGGRVVSEQIAITRVPDILLSHPDDARQAAARLRADLASQTDMKGALDG